LDKDTDKIPYRVLIILGATINYGGRVTDDKDKLLIKTILKTYINDGVFDPNYKFSASGVYYAPQPCTHAEYVDYIKGLPLDPSPEAFGLHENAEITTA
jgi:dynein heavy chain